MPFLIVLRVSCICSSRDSPLWQIMSQIRGKPKCHGLKFDPRKTIGHFPGLHMRPLALDLGPLLSGTKGSGRDKNNCGAVHPKITPNVPQDAFPGNLASSSLFQEPSGGCFVGSTSNRAFGSMCRFSCGAFGCLFGVNFPQIEKQDSADDFPFCLASRTFKSAGD